MSCISETCRYAQCVKKWMRSAMYLSSYHDICDIYHQNSMTEINSFDIYSWHKQSVYDTCQEIILPTTWKKSPSGWMTPAIILLNDLKTPQKWSLAFPRPLNIQDDSNVTIWFEHCSCGQAEEGLTEHSVCWEMTLGTSRMERKMATERRKAIAAEHRLRISQEKT